MRQVCVWIMLVPASAGAQCVWWPGFAKAVKSLPAASQHTLPESNPNLDRNLQLQADTASTDHDEIVAQGGVHALYQGYEMFADKLRGSRSTDVFRLEGNGKLIGKSETVTGDVVVVDFRNKNFAFESGRATLKPDLLQGRTMDNVYVRAGGGAGSQTDFTTEKGAFTTCDLDHPHFELRYDTNRVLPGKRIELRGVSLEVLGRTLLKLPMLVFPLDKRAPRNLPEVGQSVDEGYYIKNRFTTPLRGDNYIDERVDLMSKLGTGLGLDYNYSNTKTTGKLSLYSVSGGSQSRILTAMHQQRFGRGNLSLTSTYQQSDYLSAPTSTLWNTNAMLQLPWGTGSSNLSFTRFSSQTSGFSASSEVLSLSDDRTISRVGSHLSLGYNRADTSSLFSDPSSSERIDMRYNANASLRSFSANLQYQRSVPIGQAANFYGSSDVTPMVTFLTTADQLFGKRVSRFLPFNAQASIGQLANGSTTDNTQVTRIAFDFGFRRNEGRGSQWILDWGSQFRQGLYSDDTAQYSINYDGNLAYNFARNSSVSLAYQNLRAFGFTPLAIDSTGRSDAFNLNLNYKPSKAFTMTAQTGYDILQSLYGQTPWQLVYFRTRYNPSNWLDLNTSFSYDTYNMVWSNFRLDALMNLGSTQLTFGTRYDGLRSQFSGFNVLVNGLKTGRVTTNFLLDYNGYDQQFDAQHYQVIYDLHCAEAVFEMIDNQSGFRSGRTFSFYIRLKAFPFGSNFGYGTRGNSIGGSGFGGGGFGN